MNGGGGGDLKSNAVLGTLTACDEYILFLMSTSLSWLFLSMSKVTNTHNYYKQGLIIPKYTFIPEGGSKTSVFTQHGFQLQACRKKVKEMLVLMH